MTSAAEQVHAALAADADLAAVVGARLYHAKLPKADPETPNGRFPCVRYYAAGLGAGLDSHDGAAGWERPRWSFDCWAADGASAWALADALRAALRASALTARVVSLVDLPDAATGLHRVVVDATLWTALTQGDES